MKELKRPLKEWLLEYDPLGIKRAFAPAGQEEAGELPEEVTIVEDEEITPAPKKTPSRGGRILWYILGAVILLALGGGVFLHWKTQRALSSTGGAVSKPPGGAFPQSPPEQLWLRFGPFAEPISLPIPAPGDSKVTLEQESVTYRGTIYILARPVARDMGRKIIAALSTENLPVTYEELSPDTLTIRSLPLTDPAQKRQFPEVLARFGETLRETEGELIAPRYYLWVGPLSPGVAQVFLTHLPEVWRNAVQHRKGGPP